jgi:ribosome-associated heat shock protein Hsp15
MSASPDKCRIDKWLCAVRLFKSRTIATDAVSAGKVKLNGEAVKPSHLISAGNVVSMQKGILKYQYRVLGIIEKRVSAQLVNQYCEDITPPEEKLKTTEPEFMPSAFREKGTGRPTKKQRRDLDDWME